MASLDPTDDQTDQPIAGDAADDAAKQFVEVELVDEGRPTSKEAGVPRRFGMSTMLLFTAMFAVLFAVMKSLNTPPAMFAGIAVFFAGVGFAQMALFGGNKPRKASVIAGAVLLPVEILAAQVYWIYRESGGMGNLAGMCCTIVILIPLGAFLGYLAGGLSAGVFLVIDRVKSACGSDRSEP